MHLRLDALGTGSLRHASGLGYRVKPLVGQLSDGVGGAGLAGNGAELVDPAGGLAFQLRCEGPTAASRTMPKAWAGVGLVLALRSVGASVVPIALPPWFAVPAAA
ncbi:hypothetical protein GCM10009844_09200 [Nocardioides koreensis]|uniref:Uncharacterized protein n=1 Tax=Nocardioides koreensis TaxID=433651 RepID=A0ABN2ZCL2_9ACTN